MVAPIGPREGWVKKKVVIKMCDEVVYALKKTIRLKSENYFHGQNDETYPPPP